MKISKSGKRRRLFWSKFIEIFFPRSKFTDIYGGLFEIFRNKFRKVSIVDIGVSKNFDRWALWPQFSKWSKSIEIYRNYFDKFRSISIISKISEMISKIYLRNEIFRYFVSKNGTEPKWTISINFATSWLVLWASTYTLAYLIMVI